MGAWDFLTTGREAVQGGVGSAAGWARQNPVATALSLGTAPFWAEVAKAATGGGGGGGGSDPKSSSTAAPAPSSSGTTPASSGQVTWSPYINPLAMSGFFQSTIQPYLQGLAQQQQANDARTMGMAQADLQKFPMPAQFKSFFGQQLPQMQQDENNIIGAMQLAAQAQPEYDQMMTGLGNLQKQGATIQANVINQLAAQKQGLTTAGGLSADALIAAIGNLSADQQTKLRNAVSTSGTLSGVNTAG